MAVTAKQTTLNFGIIISIWLFHVNVLSVIIPKHVMLVAMDFILLSEPNQMAICELFLVKNCIRLVFSKFSDHKFALNQLSISVNAPLIYSMKLVVFRLVMIRLVSSANKNNLHVLLLSAVFVIFIISLTQNKNSNGPSTEPCATPCFAIPKLE